jgi:outer membrane protein TolC
MDSRYLRTILTLALIAATAIAPVAPAFGQTVNTPAPAQAPAPPPGSPPTQVQAPGQAPAPSAAGAPVAESPAAAQPAPPPAAIPDRTYLESRPNFSHGRRAFPDLFGPYIPAHVDRPKLSNAEQLVQTIHDGKIDLSLQDCIALALENNLDIEIQRYNPWIAETQVLAAKGGRTFASGNLPVMQFDPLVTANTTIEEQNEPVINPFTSGAGLGLSAFTSHQTNSSFEYQQGFATGTSITAEISTQRESTTLTEDTFNPSVYSEISFSFTQQLLNGFGIGVNKRSIRLEKIQKQISDSAFEQQVITSVTAVENAYWELVFARDSIKVGQEALTLAQQTYDDTKKEVDIGTEAQLDLVQAEAQVAQAQQTLINDQTTQLQNQTILLNLIVKDLTDPALINVEIVPTDEMQPATDQPDPDLADSLKEALANRPDVQEADLTIKGADVNVHATRNALLPSLSVTGSYYGIGLAGNSTSVTTAPTALGPDLEEPILDANGNAVLDPATGLPIYVSEVTAASTTTTSSKTGITDALDQSFHNRFPNYSVEISLSLPIRNRQAQADSADAQLTERQDEARLRQTQNNVLVAVRNAIIALVQDKAALNAATKTRILQQETLDAEEKKLKLGASTIFNVVTDQNTLATAASAEVRALANLAEAQVNFDSAMARTLEVNHITIADATTGTVPRDTLIPGTTASGALAGESTPAQGADADDGAAAGPSADETSTRTQDGNGTVENSVADQREETPRGN